MVRKLLDLAATAAVIIAMVLVVSAAWTGSASAASAHSATGRIDSFIGVFVRKAPSTDAGRVTAIPNNQKVTISRVVFTSSNKYSAKNKWYQIKYNGMKGYVRSDLIDSISYTAVSGRTTSSLKYRLGAGTGMKYAGTFKGGTNLSVFLSAGNSGSSDGWYMIKYNGKYYYVNAKYVKISGSIFQYDSSSSSASTSSSTKKTSSTTSNSSASSSSGRVSDSDFEASIKNLPSSYKTKLRALHKAHPNWRFIARDTGIKWSTALSKETRDGVSLINYVYPVSYRDTSSRSYVSSSVKVYKSASSSSGKLTTIKSGTTFKVLNEVYTKNSASQKYRWNHVRLSNGKEGYIRGSLTSESYAKKLSGKTTAKLNVRRGAGTKWGTIKTLSKGKKVSVVLRASVNGDEWYKIKSGSDYGYISSDYVNLDKNAKMTYSKVTVPVETAEGRTTKAVSYLNGPGSSFTERGSLKKSADVTICGRVRDSSSHVWYKIVVDGWIRYIDSSYVKASSSDIDDFELEEPSVNGRTRTAVKMRKSSSKSSSSAGILARGKSVEIVGAVKTGKLVWYRIKVNDKKYYVPSKFVTVYAKKFVSTRTETQAKTVYEDPDLDSLSGTGSVVTAGRFIPKDGSTWFNASSRVVGYYMDPRNFLNENSIYMFEDLGYHDYQTTAAVTKILSGTRLIQYGFYPVYFTGAGKKYGMSPIALAARARQETGGGSIAISGLWSGGKYYNPFNIGAYSSSNPVVLGLQYAKNAGWNTQKKAVYGGCDFLSKNYIRKGQNTIYFQRFNVANGASYVGTHQYMTNITVGYTEALTTRNTYKAYDITDEALTFVIPYYDDMPSSTTLP